MCYQGIAYRTFHSVGHSQIMIKKGGYCYFSLAANSHQSADVKQVFITSLRT